MLDHVETLWVTNRQFYISNQISHSGRTEELKMYPTHLVFASLVAVITSDSSNSNHSDVDAWKVRTEKRLLE